MVEVVAGVTRVVEVVAGVTVTVVEVVVDVLLAIK